MLYFLRSAGTPEAKAGGESAGLKDIAREKNVFLV
jgi:hypothetical protein